MNTRSTGIEAESIGCGKTCLNWSQGFVDRCALRGYGPPPMTAPGPRAVSPAREAFLVWVAVIVTLGVVKVALSWVPYGASITGAIAVALFLWAPAEVNRRLGRNEDDGLTSAHLGRDVAFAVVVMAVVFPLFVVG